MAVLKKDPLQLLYKSLDFRVRHDFIIPPPFNVYVKQQ